MTTFNPNKPMPRPWVIKEYDSAIWVESNFDSDASIAVAKISMIAESDRQFMIKAVNNHDALVHSVKMLLACGIVAKYPKDDGKTFIEAKLYAEQALKSAESEGI